jgi:hypothetical protein
MEVSQNQWRNFERTQSIFVQNYKLYNWTDTTHKPNAMIYVNKFIEKRAPKYIRNQGLPLKRLLDEWDRNRPEMAYFHDDDDDVIQFGPCIILVIHCRMHLYSVTQQSSRNTSQEWNQKQVRPL